MCKAPLSAILCLPLEWHVRENPFHQATLEQAAAAALKQQSTLKVMVWWDKLFCTHVLGTKALKLRHSHIISPLTRLTVRVSSETQPSILLCSPFWGPHCRGRAGEQCWACGGSTGPAQSKPGRATAQPQTTKETSGSSKLDNPAKPYLRLLQSPAQHS